MTKIAIGCKTPDETKGETLDWEASARRDPPETKTKTKTSDAGKDGSRGAGESTEESPAVTRGRYLVDHVAGCNDCHTPGGSENPDPSRYLSGVDCLADLSGAQDQGCLNSGNLTNSRTGLGRRSDAQIKAMFLNGRRPEGTVLHPTMPYWLFHNMKEEDADAIVSYLRTVPAVDRIVPPSSLKFMMRTPAAPIDKASIPKAKGTAVDGGPDPENGRYLASMVGRCIECHTPEAPEGSIRPIDMKKAFGGNRAFSAAALGLQSPPMPKVIYSTNITSAPVSGIGGWSVRDIVRSMTEGRDRNNGKMCPPMPFGPMGAYGGLTDQDALDIATYIYGLPPIDKFTSGDCLIQLEE